MSYNFNMDEQKPIFTTDSDAKVTRTTVSAYFIVLHKY